MFLIARSPAAPRRPVRAAGIGSRLTGALACAGRGRGPNQRANLRHPRTLPAG